jgi:hypothetical protein
MSLPTGADAVVIKSSPGCITFTGECGADAARRQALDCAFSKRLLKSQTFRIVFV